MRDDMRGRGRLGGHAWERLGTLCTLGTQGTPGRGTLGIIVTCIGDASAVNRFSSAGA